MENRDFTAKIIIALTTEQKNDVIDAARASGVNVSEYVRAKLAQLTTHRASFAIPGENNEFYTETEQGFVGDTRTMNVAHTLTREMSNRFAVHIRDGYHADCVICQSKYTDPRTLVSETPDDDESDCPSADPQPDPRSEAEQAADDDAADQERTQNDARPY